MVYVELLSEVLDLGLVYLLVIKYTVMFVIFLVKELNYNLGLKFC